MARCRTGREGHRGHRNDDRSHQEASHDAGKVPVAQGRRKLGAHRQASNLLSMDERSRRLAQRLEWPLLVAAILTVPVLVLEYGKYGEPWDSIGKAGDWITWLMFVFELVAMLVVVPNRRA